MYFVFEFGQLVSFAIAVPGNGEVRSPEDVYERSKCGVSGRLPAAVSPGAHPGWFFPPCRDSNSAHRTRSSNCSTAALTARRRIGTLSQPFELVGMKNTSGRNRILCSAHLTRYYKSLPLEITSFLIPEPNLSPKTQMRSAKFKSNYDDIGV